MARPHEMLPSSTRGVVSVKASPTCTMQLAQWKIADRLIFSLRHARMLLVPRPDQKIKISQRGRLRQV